MLLSISMLYLAPVTSPPPVFCSVSPHTERLEIDSLPTELGWNNIRTSSSDFNCNKWLAVWGWDPDFRRSLPATDAAVVLCLCMSRG